jgi:hypothetical protein
MMTLDPSVVTKALSNRRPSQYKVVVGEENDLHFYGAYGSPLKIVLYSHSDVSGFYCLNLRSSG